MVRVTKFEIEKEWYILSMESEIANALTRDLIRCFDSRRRETKYQKELKQDYL